MWPPRGEGESTPIPDVKCKLVVLVINNAWPFATFDGDAHQLRKEKSRNPEGWWPRLPPWPREGHSHEDVVVVDDEQPQTEWHEGRRGRMCCSRTLPKETI